MPVNPPKPEPALTEKLGKAISKKADLWIFYLGLGTGIALTAILFTLGMTVR